MSFVTRRTVYFKEVGVHNTDETLRIAKERAEELGIRSIVVASTTGGTGVKAVEALKGYNVVVVTHSSGFRSPDTQELEEENRAKILAGGGRILTTTHAFGGIGRAIHRKFDAIQVDEIIANVLRLFGQGMKVACEITAMAADTGLVRTEEDVIAIAGSGRGADTAIVVKPANVNAFFDLKVREVLCKPLL